MRARDERPVSGDADPSPPVRGRSAELHLIDRLVSRLRSGQASTLVIEGPPGIGKSRLLREVSERTVRAGGRALCGHAYEHQRTVPFAPLLDATVGADPPIGGVEALREMGASADLRYWVVNDLQAAIADAAPVSVAIEDVHLADGGTLAALSILTAGLADVPVLWALTTRTGSIASRVLAALDVTADEDHIHHLELSGIGSAAATDIVSDVLGGSPDETLQELAEMAHGNPFLLQELLRGLLEEGRIQRSGGRASAIGSALPLRLRATMDDRLSGLSRLARQAVEVAAVLPENFSVTVLARMLERRPAELVSAVTEAIRADLFVDDRDRLKFRHDLLRRAARDTVPGPLLRVLERDSADILLETGASPEEVATQMARSAEVGDAAAVQALRWAARSLACGDASGAADLSRRAQELADDTMVRGEIAVETIELLIRAMRFPEAELVALDALASDLPAELEARIRLSLTMMSVHWPAERVAENLRVRALAGISAQTRARNEAWLAYNMWLDGQADAGAVARDAFARLTEMADVETRVLAGTTVAGADLSLGHARRCSQLLDELRSTAGRIGGGASAGQMSVAIHACILAVLGRVTEASGLIAEGLAAAEAERITTAVELLTLTQASVDYAAGRLTAARTAMAPFFDQPDFAWSRVGSAMVTAQLSAIALQTDDTELIDDTETVARDALQWAGTAAVRRHAVCVLAHTAWHRDDLATAAGLLAEDLHLMSTPLWPIILDDVVLVARVAAATAHAGVRRHAEALVRLLDNEQDGLPLFVGVRLHVRGLLARDAVLLAQAGEILATSERPLLHAMVVEDAGLLLRESERQEVAVRRLNGAFDLYNAHGAVAGARRVSRALQTLGVTRRLVRPRAATGWDSLTASELRVVEIIASGATSPETARRLSISPHTVNTHLRNAYAKLGIRSRSQLMSLMADLSAADPV
jgi:DNA-binding CsgD family transcriptional regulator